MIYESNFGNVTAQLITRLNECLPGGSKYQVINRAVSVSMLTEVSKRIHEKGLAADGGIIGVYSTKPIYISKTANPGKDFGEPTGKNGQSVFKSGKKSGKSHTSKYYQQGYLGYKNDIGRNELGTVNLSLSGQLQKQFTIIPADNGWGMGWPNDEMYFRALALEQKYGKPIWALTKEEYDILRALYKEEFFNAIFRQNSQPN